MHDYTGNLKTSEYERMKAGMIWEYIPEHLLNHVKEAIEIGYEVVPGFINGYNTGNGFIVYQLHPIHSDQPVLQTK